MSFHIFKMLRNSLSLSGINADASNYLFLAELVRRALWVGLSMLSYIDHQNLSMVGEFDCPLLGFFLSCLFI